MEILGIDIGSKGIKGAIVDVEKGAIVSGKKSTDVIEDTRPHKLISRLHKVVKKFDWKGPVGCAFPAAVHKGIVLSGEQVNKAWVDADAEHLFSEITGCKVNVINKSDAMGIAEMTFGVGKKANGTVIILNVGSGFGSSIFVDGQLVPNTELGKIEIKGIRINEWASNKSRKEEGISRKSWSKRLQFVMEHYQNLFHPRMFIMAGQLSKKPEKTLPYIKLSTKFKSAEFGYDASIVGAAYYAAIKQKLI